jgi:hypothetical protein
MTMAGSHVQDVRAVGSEAVDRLTGIDGPLIRQSGIKRVFVVPERLNQPVDVVSSILSPEKDRMCFMVRISLSALKPAELNSLAVVFVTEIAMGEGDAVIDHCHNRGGQAFIRLPPRAAPCDCIRHKPCVQHVLRDGSVHSIAKLG